MNYNYKGEAAQVYDANKKRLRLEGRILLDRLLNEVLHEMTSEFQDALVRGELLSLGGTREEIQSYLRNAARKQLEAGS